LKLIVDTLMMRICIHQANMVDNKQYKRNQTITAQTTNTWSSLHWCWQTHRSHTVL